LGAGGGGGETVSLRFTEQVAVWECVKMRAEMQPSCEVSGVPFCSVSVWQSGNGRRWVEIRVKTLPWSVWLIIFKKRFNGNYGVKLTPNKLQVLCEVDWLDFGVGWPLEGSLDKTMVNKVCRVFFKKNTKLNTLKPRRMGKAKRLKLVFKTRQCCLFNFS
jgi:hypothetical protein